MSSKYLSREVLADIVDDMIVTAKRRKNKVNTLCIAPNGFNSYIKNDYWYRFINKIDDSITHYCKTSGVSLYFSNDDRYSIRQLEVLAYILSLRRNNVSQVL